MGNYIFNFDFRLERHSLEVSATVFKDILIGNSARQNHPDHHQAAGDFAEIDELVRSTFSL